MRRLPLFLILAMLGVGLCAQQTTQPPAPATPQQQRREPPAPKNLQVFPKDTTGAELIGHMRTIAQSLGVQCGFCHVRGDFASDDKDTKQIARKMLRMVDAINKDNFGGKAQVSCYTCHRGAQMPLTQVPAEPEGRGGAR